MPQREIDPLHLIMWLWPAGSLAGCAALLRINQRPTGVMILGAILNSGFIASIIGSIMVHYFGVEKVYLIVGVSLLAGLGGNTAIDFTIELAKTIVNRKVGP